MSKRMVQIFAILAFVVMFSIFSGAAQAEDGRRAGLLGVKYGGSDFSGLGRSRIIISLARETMAEVDRSVRAPTLSPNTGELR